MRKQEEETTYCIPQPLNKVKHYVKMNITLKSLIIYLECAKAC